MLDDVRLLDPAFVRIPAPGKLQHRPMGGDEVVDVLVVVPARSREDEKGVGLLRWERDVLDPLRRLDAREFHARVRVLALDGAQRFPGHGEDRFGVHRPRNHNLRAARRVVLLRPRARRIPLDALHGLRVRDRQLRVGMSRRVNGPALSKPDSTRSRWRSAPRRWEAHASR